MVRKRSFDSPRIWGSLRTDRGHAQSGFTLIELLVVIMIMGIMTTFITLSVRGRGLDDKLAEDSERLYQVLLLAQEEAQMKGIELGFRVTSQGYEFLVLGDGNQWQVVDAAGPFRPRSIESPLVAELRVEGRVVPPAIEKDGEDEDEKIEPQFILLSSGETTGFSLDLKAKGVKEYYRVEGDIIGRIEQKKLEERS